MTMALLTPFTKLQLLDVSCNIYRLSLVRVLYDCMSVIIDGHISIGVTCHEIKAT